VLATDLSRRALDLARSAEWPLARAEQLSPTWRKEFMLRGEEKMRAGPRLREVVRFGAGEPQRARPPAAARVRADLLPANVLIYFDAESKARVLSALAPQLAPGGLLLLGHAKRSAPTKSFRSVVPTIYAAAGA